MLVSTTACVTFPKTKWQFPIGIISCNTHSKETGDSATRGAVTVKLCSLARSAISNSLISGGQAAPVKLTESIRLVGAIFTTNSFVASMFVRESFTPTEVNWIMGGSTEATVKNECGARLSTPL